MKSMSPNLKIILSLLLGALFYFGCGDDNSDATGDGSGQMGGSTCFTSDECAAGQYCKADDPFASPEGTCGPLEEDGGECTSGTQCVDGLVCLKSRGRQYGACTSYPDDCEEGAGPCMCALQLCSALAGSSCSPAVLDDAENSLLVVCPE